MAFSQIVLVDIAREILDSVVYGLTSPSEQSVELELADAQKLSCQASMDALRLVDRDGQQLERFSVVDAALPSQIVRYLDLHV
jgi:hypothetical protein